MLNLEPTTSFSMMKTTLTTNAPSNYTVDNFKVKKSYSDFNIIVDWIPFFTNVFTSVFNISQFFKSLEFLRSFVIITICNRLFIMIVVIYYYRFCFQRAIRENTSCTKLELIPISTSQSYSDGEEMYKKASCPCRVVVLQIQIYCFFGVLVDLAFLVA